ncbi:exosortase A [Tsuneonella sp. YG55]|uniref:Exosortase A n=1 Tax=Tsuneonella litorea TaxID=2976475 RepID=A0A9X2W0E5_9SPHN|nr:exosortase A [Tsuneonella litorea]MCT2558747.1 exosortase A [Tsuneonella litorea]
MQPELAASPARAPASAWGDALTRLAAAWGVLFGLTFPEWREMAHQWWDIDTYNHVLLVPPILAWLVWLRREELAKIVPRTWVPGLVWLAVGLCVCLAGRGAEVNLVAQGGVIMAFQGTVVALLGLRAALILAFPLLFAGSLVPFGDEIIPPLQHVTAQLAVAVTHLSGVPAVIDGLTIDTPGGRFLVAEECSGVKFLVAMVALTTLAAWTGFRRWRPRIVLVACAAVVSIVANGLRAWGTIYVAQWVGAERAGGFDHIVYGWVFFALVIAAVMGAAWRHFDRDPADAGMSADEVAAHPLVRLERFAAAPHVAFAAFAVLAIGFAALGLVV